MTVSDGSIAWLEQGTSSAGLEHIINNHGLQFAQFGIGEEDIPGLIMDTLSNKAPTQYIPDLVKGGGQFIYNTLGDVEHDFSIVVGSNGYIITAFPGL